MAHAGVSSRRAAATLVKEGKVTVNGVVVTDPGTKVLYTDTVKVAGKKVTVSSHFVYILLNKPKDFLTTTTDPQGRKTVQQLIAKQQKKGSIRLEDLTEIHPVFYFSPTMAISHKNYLIRKMR